MKKRRECSLRAAPAAGHIAGWVLAAAACSVAWAQPALPALARDAAPDATPDATRIASVPTAANTRPVTELRVIEDDQVRIEEMRVRGQLRRVTVAPKGSAMRPYEINVGAAGRDPSQDKSSAGQRVWSVLRF